MKVVVISGPTASGKTDLSINLAKHFQGEIVNFDSLLFYKEINIGTAKPTKDERDLVPHHLIDIRSINEPINASDFVQHCLPVMDRLNNENKVVFLVGGSGFYLQALLKGMYESPTTPLDIQKKSETLFKDQGIAPFLKELELHDPKSFSNLHPNDHYRIIRAVEHWWANHTPFSELREKQGRNRKLINGNIHGWELCHIYLNIPKEEHLKIIETRSKKMIDHGLIEEVQHLLDAGFKKDLKPLQSIGYKETLEYLENIIPSKEALLEKIIISTRQLAKSQRTWFNRDPSKTKFNPLTEDASIHKFVESFLTHHQNDF